MPIRYLPHTRFARANRKAGGGVTTSIPDPSEALFTLNTIVGDNMIDAINGWEFPITGKDWESDEWALPLLSLPWKTSATISAPADGSAAATAIQLIDSDNFWYAVGGVANVIPIQAFFQNINFSDLYFCRHIERTANGVTGVEEYPPSVTDITLYNTARTVTSTYTDYFGTEIVAAVGALYSDIVNGDDTTGDGSFGNPYQTINKSMGTLGAGGGTVYLFGGTYTESLFWNRPIEFIGINFPKLTGSDGAAATAIVNTASVFMEWSHLNIDGESVKLKGFVTSNALQVVRKTRIENTTTYALESKIGQDSGEIKDSVCIGTSFNGWGTALKIKGVYHKQLGIDNSVALLLTVNSNVTYEYNKFQTMVGATGSQAMFTGDSDIVFKYSKFDSNSIGRIFFNTTGIAIDIQYCDFLLPDWESILLGAFTGIEFTNFVWKNNTLINDTLNTPNGKFYLDIRECPTVAIENNYFYNGGQVGSLVSVLAATAVAQTVSVKNNISYNKNHDNYSYRLGQEGTSDGDDQMAITFENNILYGAGFFGDYTGASHAVLIGYQANPIVRFNRIIGNAIGFVFKHNSGDYATSEIHSNILIECGQGMLPKGVVDCNLYGNTFKNEVNNGVAIKTETATGGTGLTENLSIRNNIMVNTHASGNYAIVISDGDEVGLDADYNSYYFLFAYVANTEATTRTWAQWQGLGFDANGTELTETQQLALFTDYDNDDFSLIVGSEAIGTGETLAALYDDGLDATTVWGTGSTLPVIVTKQQTAPWDKGAYIT